MKRLTLLIGLIVSTFLGATTWIVKPDGSGQFTQIQAAINASAHSDSIKVYPGTYMENIDFSGKNIFIYSLEYTTGNPAFRDSTVIDGNRSGSVVKSVAATTNCGIYGFTLQNGSGDISYYEQLLLLSAGGGLMIKNAQHFTISSCNINNNAAYIGGGIYLYYAMVYMDSCIIKDNFATLGGGLLIGIYSRVYFDQILRSSVFNNIAGHGQDILASSTRLDLEVYLDMGTVNYHDSYFVHYAKGLLSDTGNLLGVDIQRAYLAQINADIYVAPEGSDLNDGLSQSTPLKSIFRAMQIVQSDSLSPNTVHLAAGDYSTEAGQFFPIGLKSFVKVQGAGIGNTNLINSCFDTTILGQRIRNPEIEGVSLYQDNNPIIRSPIIYSRVVDGKTKDVYMHSIASANTGGIYLGSNSDYYSNCMLENVTIFDQHTLTESGLFALVVDLDVDRLTIENCTVTGGANDLPSSLFYFRSNKLKMKNSKIINNTIINNEPNIMAVGFNGEESTRELKLDNVLVANNQTGGGVPVFIANFNDNPGIINNCTFANNRGANYGTLLNGNFIVNNCIFDNNTPLQIVSAGESSVLSFNNNFISNYPSSTLFQAVNNVSFNDVVLTGDPGFRSSVASDPLSYRLADDSICRDRGDSTGLELPDTDLAGNPRIYGFEVDLGCYEWTYPMSMEEDFSPGAIQLAAFPNPFSEHYTLLFNLKQRGLLNCEIFNVKGQRVRSLADSHYTIGDHMLVWDGCDNAGIQLGSGIYFIRMQLDDRVIATRKMIMTK